MKPLRPLPLPVLLLEELRAWIADCRTALSKLLLPPLPLPLPPPSRPPSRPPELPLLPALPPALPALLPVLPVLPGVTLVPPPELGITEPGVRPGLGAAVEPGAVVPVAPAAVAPVALLVGAATLALRSTRSTLAVGTPLASKPPITTIVSAAVAVAEWA